jgi:TM2 domain-containing membrane protein YozV
MKKLILLLTLFVSSVSVMNAENYKLNDLSVDALYANSQDVTSQMFEENTLNTNLFSTNNLSADSQYSGYLVRAFFCGSIALHRYYMGCGNKNIWALYCCVPLVGSFAALVDFWWVVFNKSALDKYKNNDKYLVFLK